MGPHFVASEVVGIVEAGGGDEEASAYRGVIFSVLVGASGHLRGRGLTLTIRLDGRGIKTVDGEGKEALKRRNAPP